MGRHARGRGLKLMPLQDYLFLSPRGGVVDGCCSPPRFTVVHTRGRGLKRLIKVNRRYDILSPPRGGRGLKLPETIASPERAPCVAPTRGRGRNSGGLNTGYLLE